MSPSARGSTRRRFAWLAVVAFAPVAGCSKSGSREAAEAKTRTPNDAEASRREAVESYAEGVERFEEGRSALFDGNGALEEDDHHAAEDAFERAEVAFEDAREAFEEAYEFITWLDFESERDAKRARTVVEDAGLRTDHHLEAAADLRRVAVRRAEAGDDAGDDHLEVAREQLDEANDYRIRETSALAAILSVDAE